MNSILDIASIIDKYNYEIILPLIVNSSFNNYEFIYKYMDTKKILIKLNYCDRQNIMNICDYINHLIKLKVDNKVYNLNIFFNCRISCICISFPLDKIRSGSISIILNLYDSIFESKNIKDIKTNYIFSTIKNEVLNKEEKGWIKFG